FYDHASALAARAFTFPERCARRYISSEFKVILGRIRPSRQQFRSSMLATPEREPAASRWATRAALFAFGLLVSAALLFRLFGLPSPIAYNLAAVSMGIAVASIASAAVAAVIIWRTGRPGTARVLFASGLSLALLSLPLVLLVWSRDFPPLNDVTTDVERPPQLIAAAELRGPGDNPVVYSRRLAEEQRRAYPDIVPVR